MSNTFKPLYVGAQNDCLFIIDQPPRPSNDDVNPVQNVKVIAKVYPGPDDDRYARLFAASPDLLEACRSLVAECKAAFINPETMSSEFQAVYKSVDAAISKATGGQS